MKKYWKYIIAALVLFLVGGQFFPIDKTNPPVEVQQDFITMTSPTPEVERMLRAACYDCHSHEVRYPWYTDVAPISWWVKGHINNGVKHLNLSKWGAYSEGKKDHKLEEAIEFMEKNGMPLTSYKLAHADARLDQDQRSQLIEFFQQLRRSEG